MGVTIHYQGHLSDPQQLPDLITAIQRSCRTLEWRRDWGISAGEN